MSNCYIVPKEQCDVQCLYAKVLVFFGNDQGQQYDHTKYFFRTRLHGYEEFDGNTWFPQDGTTGHTTRSSLATINELFSGKVISKQRDLQKPQELLILQWSDTAYHIVALGICSSCSCLFFGVTCSMFVYYHIIKQIIDYGLCNFTMQS